MSTTDMQRFARAVDDLGFDGLLVPEHIVLPPDLADTMGAHWPDALTAMAFLAGVSPVRVDPSDHRPLGSGSGAPLPTASAQGAVDAVGALADSGVTWTSVPPPGPPTRSLDEYLERLDWVAREVIAQFR